jgi:hypothetical protein
MIAILKDIRSGALPKKELLCFILYWMEKTFYLWTFYLWLALIVISLVVIIAIL